MATTLAPVDQREVVRCDRCQLVQFRTVNNLCRRCHRCLDPEELPVMAEPVADSASEQPLHGNGNGNGHVHIAVAIRSLRQRTGLSQRQLAMRMAVPRTYVSKIENDKATPTLSSLERLAKALQVSVPDLLRGCQPMPGEEIRDLMADDFIAQLMPFALKLDCMQRSTLIAQLRELSLRPRRTA